MKIDINNIDRKTYRELNKIKKILGLFDLTVEDLNNFIKLLKNYDNIIDRINQISKDQELINERLSANKSNHIESNDDKLKEMYKELNQPARGNYYGK